MYTSVYTIGPIVYMGFTTKQKFVYREALLRLVMRNIFPYSATHRKSAQTIEWLFISAMVGTLGL